jgi:hypothetical protein
MNPKRIIQTSLFLCCISSATCEPLPLTNNVLMAPDLEFWLTAADSAVPPLEFRADETVFRALAGNWGDPTGRNLVVCRALPFNSTYDFRMWDAQGRELPKTKYGKQMSQPPPTVKTVDDVMNFKILGIIGHDIRALFRPDEVCEITNAGVYELEVKIRLCVPMTNGVPDTNAVKLLHYYPIYGIVTSPPVRVRVIKNSNSRPIKVGQPGTPN